MLTYGDGVSDVNLNKLYNFHKKNKKLATITAVNLAGRFGVLKIDETETINKFSEKTKED